jgi:perosamine synthetase
MKNRGFIVSGLHFPNHFYSVFGSQTILSGVEDFYKRYIALPSGWWVKQEQIKSLEW